MAMFVNNKSGTGYRRGRRAMSDINVTPMVDVMLVLLVIFMVTAPMLATGVEVDLPESATKNALPQGGETPLTVVIQADGSVSLNDGTEQVFGEGDQAAFVAKMQAIYEANREMTLYVRGDRAVNYGRVMEMMGALREAGIERLGLVTTVPTSN